MNPRWCNRDRDRVYFRYGTYTRIHGASAHPTYPPNNGYGRVIGEIYKQMQAGRQ